MRGRCEKDRNGEIVCIVGRVCVWERDGYDGDGVESEDVRRRYV